MFLRLAPKLAHLFTSTVRSRGQNYYGQGSVRIQRGSARAVEALVWGSQGYEVQVECDNGELSLFCSCPYFESEGPCKHVWATVLAAEARGYLSKVGSIPNLMDYSFDGLEDDLDEDLGVARRLFAVPTHRLRARAAKPSWRAQIATVAGSYDKTVFVRGEWPAKRQILYLVDVLSSAAAGHLILSLCSRDSKKDGAWGRVSAINLQRGQIPSLPLAEDREILSAIAGASQYYGGLGDSYGQIPGSCLIRYPLAGTLIPLVARTGRCYLRNSAAPDDLTPLAWDQGGPWRFELELRVDGKQQRGSKPVWLVAGVLRREEETMEASAPALVTPGGHVFVRGMVAPLVEDTSFNWLLHLRRSGSVQAPEEDLDELLSTLLCTPGLPRLEVPKQLRYEEVTLPPRPCLRIRAGDRHAPNVRLGAELLFDYDGRMVPALDRSRGFYNAAENAILQGAI